MAPVRRAGRRWFVCAGRREKHACLPSLAPDLYFKALSALGWRTLERSNRNGVSKNTSPGAVGFPIFAGMATFIRQCRTDYWCWHPLAIDGGRVDRGVLVAAVRSCYFFNKPIGQLTVMPPCRWTAASSMLVVFLILASEAAWSGAEPLPRTGPPQAREGFGAPLPDLTDEQRARFQAGQTAFERVFTPRTDFWAVFNGQSCAECHAQSATDGTHDTITRFRTPLSLNFAAGLVAQASRSPHIPELLGPRWVS